MRIAFVAESMWQGGASVYMDRLATGLKAGGNEVIFVAKKDRYGIANRFEFRPAPDGTESEVLKSVAPDIYHYHSGAVANHSFDTALQNMDAPVVETMHSFGLRHHLPDAAHIFVSQRQAIAVANGNDYEIIPPGFPVGDLTSLSLDHIDKENLSVGMIGSRTDQGIQSAIDAVEFLREDTGLNIGLRIFGVDHSWQSTRRWLQSNVWEIPSLFLYKKMAECDVALHAAPREECWSQAVTEWMLLGKPVVINQKAMFDLCDQNCLSFEDNNALKLALMDCLDSGVRQEVGMEGKEMASKYTMERCALEHENLYSEMRIR